MLRLSSIHPSVTLQPLHSPVAPSGVAGPADDTQSARGCCETALARLRLLFCGCLAADPAETSFTPVTPHTDPARSRPPGPPRFEAVRAVALVQEHRRQAVDSLRPLFAHPGLSCDRGGPDGRPRLLHPLAEPVEPGLLRHGGYLIQADEQLLGSIRPLFDPFALLRRQFADTVLAALGAGPQAVLLLFLQRHPEPPLALCISPAPSCTALQAHGQGAVQDLLAPAWQTLLALVYLLAMGDGSGMPVGLARKVARDAVSGALKIVAAYDDQSTGTARPPATLLTRSVLQLFGIPRSRLDDLLLQADTDTLEFASRNRMLLDWRGPQRCQCFRPELPYTRAFRLFVEQCRLRLSRLDP